jgi:hypothetical protein
MPSVNPKRAHRPECWLLRRYVMERIRDLYGVTL